MLPQSTTATGNENEEYVKDKKKKKKKRKKVPKETVDNGKLAKLDSLPQQLPQSTQLMNTPKKLLLESIPSMFSPTPPKSNNQMGNKGSRSNGRGRGVIDPIGFTSVM